uniref:Uncharacterized protein n=3 Tax=Oryza rufipogon TaxID=4529 RepID=A0A0E0Q6E7_ORYRU
MAHEGQRRLEFNDEAAYKGFPMVLGHIADGQCLMPCRSTDEAEKIRSPSPQRIRTLPPSAITHGLMSIIARLCLMAFPLPTIKVEKPSMCSIGLKIGGFEWEFVFWFNQRMEDNMIYPIKDQETMLAVPMDMNRQQDTVCSKGYIRQKKFEMFETT